MSDQKLRDLERRWKESGALADEASYLLERVRVGDLSQERLELAAYCGHEGAGTLLATSGPNLLHDARAWVAAPILPSQRHTAVLGRLQHHLLVRIGHAALSLVTTETNNPGYTRPLSRVAEWLHCPCGRHANAASNLMVSTMGELVRQKRADPTLMPLGGAVVALLHAVAAPRAPKRGYSWSSCAWSGCSTTIG